MRGLVKSIDIVAKHRAGLYLLYQVLLTINHRNVELAVTTKDFATSISELSASELGPQLGHSLAALADLKHIAAEAQSTQSQQDIITLMSTGRFPWSDFGGRHS